MTLGDIYGFVVYNCGISPNYFLDEMSSDEVGYLSKTYIAAHREKWEMLRMQNHAILAPHSKNKLELRDVMKFEWDNEVKENSTPKESSAEAVKRIKEKFNLK